MSVSAIVAASIAAAAGIGNAIFQSQQAKKNRELQKDLAINSYQYAVEDMKKAGINPLLAYSQGGSSTVSGSTVQGTPFTGVDVGRDFEREKHLQISSAELKLKQDKLDIEREKHEMEMTAYQLKRLKEFGF